MLINKDYEHAHQVRLTFHDEDSHRDQFLAGQVTVITFGKAQYQWHADRKRGHADPDRPPIASTLKADGNTRYNLPAASLTIVRGRN